MSKYKVSLRLGSRTHTIDKPIEAKSLQDLKDFLEATTKGQIVKIMKIAYEDEFDNREDNPNDYYNETKVIYQNTETILTAQFRLPWLKKSAVSTLSSLIKKYLQIDGNEINSVNNPIY